MNFDVVVIGAGAAGMMCAAQAGKRGRRVLLIEHAENTGERIRISGGGRCNFSNRRVGPENYLSQNPHFCRSALARYTQQDFIALVDRHRIAWHEREHGQLFCDDTAQDIIDMLKAECDEGQVQWAQPCAVRAIGPESAMQTARAGGGPDMGTNRRVEDTMDDAARDNRARFSVATDRGRFGCRSVVIATGGLAVPQLGASPLGYRIAEQFGLAIVPPKPALVPLALAPEALARLKPLAGVSFDTLARCDWGVAARGAQFREAALITHRGLSGPAILQISSYWQMQEYQLAPGGKKQPVELDLLPGIDATQWLSEQRHSKALLQNLLAERLPRSFAQAWCASLGWNKPVNQLPVGELESAAHALNHWALAPSGTLGYAKAEVTLGGVDTGGLSSKTMEARRARGLYFIGEVVDVTGWLGGYNFQWAWSSGWVAGQYA
jgi:hypothetical protein